MKINDMNILKDTQGFTLIETLIAMLVLTIGVLALSTMQITSTKGNTSANKLTLAGTLAGNSYERLLNMAYSDPAMDPATNPHDETELAGLQISSAVTSISWNVTEWTNTDGINNDGDRWPDNTEKIDEADELGIKQVVLNINYNDRVAKILTINFYKSEML
jgi:type IV pilus modification protein PilV